MDFQFPNPQDVPAGAMEEELFESQDFNNEFNINTSLDIVNFKTITMKLHQLKLFTT